MAVEVKKFRREPQLASLTHREAEVAALSQAALLQDNAAVMLETAIESHQQFHSVRELRRHLQALGLFTGYVGTDTDLRLAFEEEGTQLPETAAVVFLSLFSQELPQLYLGALMVSYNQETELEWGGRV